MQPINTVLELLFLKRTDWVEHVSTMPGTDPSILIHEVLIAMRAGEDGGTIDNITRTVHIHPALSVVARAAAGIYK
jgi:pyruvate/2-oxoglutarate dehydrogenase complex dihydrolipoamide dehydrogenase (E3) component